LTSTRTRGVGTMGRGEMGLIGPGVSYDAGEVLNRAVDCE